MIVFPVRVAKTSIVGHRRGLALAPGPLAHDRLHVGHQRLKVPASSQRRICWYTTHPRTELVQQITPLPARPRRVSNPVDPAYNALPGYFLQRMHVARGNLLDAAVAAKTVRSGIDADHLLLAVAALCGGPKGEEPRNARQMVDLLVDGLRYGRERADPVPSTSRRIQS